MASRLNLAARKMFVRDLKDSRATVSSVPGLKVWEWKNTTNSSRSSSATYSVVWIQGLVQDVRQDEFTLRDDTGSARVLITSSLPSGCPAPTAGGYVMIIGELIEANPVPVLSAMKIQDLSNDPVLQKIWNLEVEDARNWT